MGHAWQTQKELLNEPIPTPEDIEVLFNSIGSERSKALFCVAYLTAGRIREVLSLEASQFTQVDENGCRVLLIQDMRNAKNRAKKFKTIPLPMDEHKPLIEFLLYWLTVRDGKRLFDFYSVRRGEQLIMEATGMNPHFIRHIRLTHLAQYKNFNHIKLMKYAGWTDPKYADRYVNFNWKDLI